MSAFKLMVSYFTLGCTGDLIFDQMILLLTTTEDGTNVYDALEKGLDDLMDLCDVVTDKFTLARDVFTVKEG